MKKLGIIIPTKGNVNLLVRLLNSVVFHCEYDRDLMTFYIADTGSDDSEKKILKYYFSKLKNEYGIKIVFIEYDYYNFAKINNDVIKNHVSDDTELILLMNNDVELISDAISYAVACYNEYSDNVGTVGARLMFENLTVQHLGISFTEKMRPLHLYYKDPFPKELDGKVAKVWGNTGAFLLTSKKLWDEIGGLDEGYNICFEDVQYNLECIKRGKSNYCVMDAICYHKESYTRGKKIDKKDAVRLNRFIFENKDEIL